VECKKTRCAQDIHARGDRWLQSFVVKYSMVTVIREIVGAFGSSVSGRLVAVALIAAQLWSGR
jgi:hypothetical protein